MYIRATCIYTQSFLPIVPLYSLLTFQFACYHLGKLVGWLPCCPFFFFFLSNSMWRRCASLFSSAVWFSRRAVMLGGSLMLALCSEGLVKQRSPFFRRQPPSHWLPFMLFHLFTLIIFFFSHSHSLSTLLIFSCTT